ncbi:Reverse transcriptase [Theobroma cacao]|nr:Reverse transcriptase [Theobroma cacao]
MALFEPATPKEAFKSSKWIEAMKEELNVINLNKTWSLVIRPKHHHVLGVKWVFRKKFNSDRSLTKHKAKLVVKGFTQLLDMDYHEIFASVARMDTIRLLITLSTMFKWQIFHLDIKSAFSNGDFDWARCIDDCKSTSGYVFFLENGAFCWNSKKQKATAQSSAKAKYIATTTAANQAIWVRKILVDLGFLHVLLAKLYVDNKSVIAMVKNPIFHIRTKHIKVKYHALREAKKNQEISIQHCSFKDQLADILTKPLPLPRFKELRHKLNVNQASV